MEEAFVKKKRLAKTLLAIEQANKILVEYAAQGFRMTVRQLFYQHVARELLPNTTKSYRDVQVAARRGRLEGIIDWDAIEDRTRQTIEWQAWTSPADAIGSLTYAEDPWSDQPTRPVVWIEKMALLNVIEPACSDWHVSYFACVGYNSLSAQYETGKKLAALIEEGIKPVVLHLGDHDPSGLDMSRDNEEQLSLFAGTPIEVRRLALTMEQVRRYRPPRNPAKEKDKRFKKYARLYGRKCWELDALSPTVIDTLLRAEIEGLVDQRKWKAAKAREAKNRETMEAIVDRWDEVERLLGDDEDESK